MAKRERVALLIQKVSVAPGVLRAARERAGLRQVDVADRLGVLQVEVSTWERGRHVPVALALALADLLDLDADLVVAPVERDVAAAG